jgi:hypothetical protein
MGRALLLSALGIGAVVTAGAIFHPALLRRFGGADRCPQMANGPALEAARQTAASALAGDAPAPTLDFLGFPVGRATRAQVSSWAASQNIACTDVDGVALRCAVPASSTIPVAGGVFYRFDATRLVGIDLIAPTTDAEAPSLFQRIRNSLTATFGRAHGEDLAETLASAPAGRLSSRWRFKDLAVDVSAFHGLDGVRLRLQARAIQ